MSPAQQHPRLHFLERIEREFDPAVATFGSRRRLGTTGSSIFRRPLIRVARLGSFLVHLTNQLCVCPGAGTLGIERKDVRPLDLGLIE